MRKYETVVIVKPDLAEDDLKGLNDKVQEVLASMKGEMKRLEDWGTRKLAYLIKKFPRGRYLYLRYDGDAGLVAELERRLRLDDRVLRYQTVKLDKEPEAAPAAAVPSAPEAEQAAEPAEASE